MKYVIVSDKGLFYCLDLPHNLCYDLKSAFIFDWHDDAIEAARNLSASFDNKFSFYVISLSLIHGCLEG